MYVVGDAGGFADALTGEGIYYALESGRLAGEVAADVAHGRCRHAAYYRRLWRTVLCDTAISYALAKPFFRDVDRGIAVLESPFVWRPLVEGAAQGATLGGSVLKSAGYLVRSWARGPVRGFRASAAKAAGESLNPWIASRSLPPEGGGCHF